MERRRIDVSPIVNIANVVGANRYGAQMKRPLRIGIDVSGLTILDPEQIYLERINRFDGVLPTLLAERHRVRFFSAQLDEIEMHVWMRQQEVGDDAAEKQLVPLDAEFHL